MTVLRPGFCHIEIYNDGSLIYLYDPANVDVILNTLPPEDNYPLDERNLATAVRAGLILLVRLFQDDEICCEIGVGEPLTTKEKAGLPWLPTAQAHLRLPSGTLRVDSANSLALIPEEADEEGAEFTCEPGLYRVCIDRVSWGELDDSQDYNGPGEIITLEKLREKEFRENERALIEGQFHMADVAENQATAAVSGFTIPVGEVNDGIFFGHVYFHEDKTFWVNLTPACGEQLKLDYATFDMADDELPADLVQITVDELGMTIRGCIFGRTYFEMSKRELSRIGPEVATGLPQPFFTTGQDLIRFSWDRNSRKIKKAEREQWLKATLIKNPSPDK